MFCVPNRLEGSPFCRLKESINPKEPTCEAAILRLDFVFSPKKAVWLIPPKLGIGIEL